MVLTAMRAICHRLQILSLSQSQSRVRILNLLNASEDDLVNGIDCNEGDLSQATNPELESESESGSDSQPVECIGR